MCELLVGLPDVTVTAVGDWPSWLRIAIEARRERPMCAGCGTAAHGQVAASWCSSVCRCSVARRGWCGTKRRWRCPNWRCPVGTWSDQDPRIASMRSQLTTRAGRWATRQVGRHGRAVSEVAADLGCDWHTVMDAVIVYGQPLIDDPARFGEVTAVGLDETLFARDGPVPSSTLIDPDRRRVPRPAARCCRWS